MRIRVDIWLSGLPLILALVASGIWLVAPTIEADLRRELQHQEARNAGSELGRAGARVEVEGRELTLTTDAPLTAAGRAEGERVVAGIPGLRGPVYRVLAPATAEPFTFTVKRSKDGLVVSGYVPPGGLRAELVEIAGEGGSTVRDELRSALGAPQGFDDVARDLLRAVRRLDNASITLSDRSVSAAGDAPDSSSYREVLRLIRSVPKGYTTSAVEIRPPVVRPYTWSVARQQDRVVLGGHVPSEAERHAIVAAARAMNAGAAVEDRMDAARGLEPGVDFDGVARRVLGILGRLESGRAELNGRALAVEGQIAARDLLGELQGELKTARLPGVELERVALTPVIPRPYRFSGKRRDGRVYLSGFVGTESDRAALREIAQRRFPFDRLADDLHLADGAPDGLLPAAKLALERLSSLAEGEAVIHDRSLRLSGRSLYAELAQRTQRDFPISAPPGWTASAEVSTTPDKPLDPGFCSDLLSDVARREPLTFEAGQADLASGARKSLAGVADVMRRCGTARLLVVSAADAGSDQARVLAERRAAAVVAGLGELGVKASPKVETSPDQGGKAADRIVFEVQP